MNPPASDIVYALSRDLEEEEKAKKVMWPDTELLFGLDPDYQSDVAQIFNQIKQEVENVLHYAKVSPGCLICLFILLINCLFIVLVIVNIMETL